MRRLRAVLLNGLTAAGAIVLCVPLAELVLRVAQPTPTAYRALPPNLSTVSEVRFARGVQGPSRYEVNSMGARAREWGADRRAEYRVLCMGGSTTESLANDQSRAWTTLVEQRMGTMPDGRRVWVGNIGRSGWSTRHHSLQARHLLGVYDPDVVTVLAGVNDLASRLKSGDAYDPLFSKRPENEAELRRQSFALSPGRFADEWVYDPWHKRTRVWRLIRQLKYGTGRMPEDAQDPEGLYLRRWREARAGGRRSPELPPLAEALDEYTRNLREVVLLAKGHGARVLLMTQPVLWREGLTEEEKAMLWMGGVGDFRSRPGSLYYEPEALAEGMSAYNRRLLDVCRDTGVQCLDLAAAIPRTPEFFWDDCHFTDAGQARVAEAVAAALLGPPS